MCDAPVVADDADILGMLPQAGAFGGRRGDTRTAQGVQNRNDEDFQRRLNDAFERNKAAFELLAK